MQKYLNKISGPLLDRIDLHVEVTPAPFRELSRIPNISRTIADLAGSDDIQIEHLAEAIQYRSLDKES